MATTTKATEYMVIGRSGVGKTICATSVSERRFGPEGSTRVVLELVDTEGHKHSFVDPASFEEVGEREVAEDGNWFDSVKPRK